MYINIYIYGTPPIEFPERRIQFGGVGFVWCGWLFMHVSTLHHAPFWKINGWKITLSFCLLAYFQGELTFSVREGNGNQHLYKVGPYQL